MSDYETDSFRLDVNYTTNSKAPQFTGKVERNGKTEYLSLWLKFDKFGAVSLITGNISQFNKDSDESKFLKAMEGE